MGVGGETTVLDINIPGKDWSSAGNDRAMTKHRVPETSRHATLAKSYAMPVMQRLAWNMIDACGRGFGASRIFLPLRDW
ncbi:hypothetical protein DPF_0458 [Desulfoplanes formicivorans]|uniref:Uncharacterized protein n=1 Tax=Desulfoplanes formicivorans TaxID=1592317 RepID=A0A194AG55_9BACT|nr:hypothetical protein DPF_0458 [Desulfoplanes formicivorans]